MATLGTNAITLVDWAKSVDPNGQAADVAELLSQTNDIITDAVWKEGNLPTGHQVSVRTGLPSATWRLLNNGVAGSKSTKAQITEACGILESWCEVDKALAELNGNIASFRADEGLAHVEAMNQEFAQTLFYGNAGTAPEEFNGFSTRYSALGQNCISGGGSGSDNLSIWLVGWGPQTIWLTYPKASPAGLEHNDLGLQTIETSSGIQGSRLRVYQDQWVWKCGLVIKDWRYAVRICNIDVSALIAESSNANLTKLMIKAMYRLPGLVGGTTPDGKTMVGVKPRFYMNRTALEFLDIQRYNVMSGAGTGQQNLGGSIKYEDIDGKRVPTFSQIPIRVCDQLLLTEATVA